MGNCCTFEKQEKQQPRVIDRRSCTDVLGLIGFIAGWIIIFVLLDQSLKEGDPYKIVRGVDYNGNICGKSAAVLDKPYAAWPYPIYYKPKICVANCNATMDITNTKMIWLYPSKPIYKYCIPDFSTLNVSVKVEIKSSAFPGESQSLSNLIGQSVGDLMTAWPIILISAVVALIFSFVFTFLLRYIASCVIWICIALLAIAGIVIATSLYRLAGQVDPDDLGSDNKTKMLKYASYVTYAGTAIFLLVVFALRREIKIAVEVVKEAARAIIAMKSIVFFPIIPFGLAIGYFGFWIVACLYVFSVSTLEDNYPMPSGMDRLGSVGWPDAMQGMASDNPTTMRRYQLDENFRSYAAIFFFHMLWNTQFLFYMGFLIIAGAIASWYFARRDHKGHKIRGDAPNEFPPNPVYLSCKRSLRYHVGTVAIASFLIALIQFIRAIVKYLEKQAKPVRGPAGDLQRALLCIIGCCLKCAECCLDKVSKNALVWTAIWGDNFFSAACSSFALLWRNLRRIAAINAVSAALLVVGKITVALITMAIGGYVLTRSEPYPSDLNSPFVPMIVIFILSYVVISLFMLIFEVTIDTTFLCFLVDCEQSEDGAEMFASPSLQELVGRHAQTSTEAAEDEFARAGKAPAAMPASGKQNMMPVQEHFQAEGAVGGGRQNPISLRSLS